jgi:Family of unknown function (DUF5906)
MSDEDDIPSRANVPKLSDHPANRGNEQSTIHGAPRLDSKQAAIDWVDQHYAVIWILGKFMILNERIPGEYHLMSKKDFVDSLENIRIVQMDNGEPKTFQVSKLWLEYPNRRTYERGIVFDPKWKFDPKTMRNGLYNTWAGFAIEPKKGDCHLFLDFIKQVICNNNDLHYNWLMCWLSQIFQEPWRKYDTAVVLRGLKGIGKSFLAKTLGILMNGKLDAPRRKKLYITIDNKNSIFGNHNDHLENVLLMAIEEAIWAGDRAHESTFKQTISGETLFINPKNLPGRTVINYIRVIMMSNSDWVVPATEDERRFFVLNVNGDRKDDKVYFDALEDELNKGGFEALMYAFMNHTIDVNLRTALVTEALIEQKTHNMSGVEKWWFDLLCSGKLPFVKQDDLGYWVIKEKLYMDFCRAQNRMGDRNRLNERSFGMKLYELIPDISTGRIEKHSNGKVKSMVVSDQKYTSGSERLNVHVFPKLDMCRVVMNYRLKTQYEYGSDSEWSLPTYTESNIMSSHNLF